MTGRERVLATLNRRKPDVTAFEIGGTDCSSVHVVAYQKLRRLMGLVDKPIDVGCLGQLVARTDRDVMDALDVDAEVLWFDAQATKVWHTPFGPDLVVPDQFDVHDLADGSSIVKTPGGQIAAQRAADAYYFDPGVYPLAEVTSPRDLSRFDALFEHWDYSHVYDEPLEDLARRAQTQYMSTQRAVVSLWRMHYLQAGQLMRGFERFFLDLVENRELVRAIFEKLHEVYLRRADTFLNAFGDWFDIVFLTDDLGTQQSGLMSVRMYRDLIYPYISELVGRIKARGKKVVMHSCGSVYDFIPSMIEMGIDALNPVQVSARNMNPQKLAREFGRDIAFWGGGCDTQHALNASDPAIVRHDVRQRLEEFGPEAHLVFTQVHNIQYDVSPENILAMRDEFWRLARHG